jgi:hypothetical protein
MSGSRFRRASVGTARSRAGHRVVLALTLAASLYFAAGSLAATEVTRDSYREAVEPICQTNTQANERILAGVRKEVKANKLAPAAAQFVRAATALKQTQRQLAAVPQPSADQAKLAKWLGAVKLEATLFEQIAAQLRAGKKGAAEHSVAKLTSNAAKANNQVIAFEFHYCRFEPSRFT